MSSIIADATSAPNTAAIPLHASPARRAWRRFRANRLGYVSLLIFAVLFGLGLLSYESVIRRDYPVVFGSLFVYTIIGLLTNLIRDLTYVWVDPRVKFFD